MHKGYQPHKEALAEMDNKGRVSPTPEKMYVRNPNPRPIDGILIHKLTKGLIDNRVTLITDTHLVTMHVCICLKCYTF